MSVCASLYVSLLVCCVHVNYVIPMDFLFQIYAVSLSEWYVCLGAFMCVALYVCLICLSVCMYMLCTVFRCLCSGGEGGGYLVVYFLEG